MTYHFFNLSENSRRCVVHVVVLCIFLGKFILQSDTVRIQYYECHEHEEQCEGRLILTGAFNDPHTARI